MEIRTRLGAVLFAAAPELSLKQAAEAATLVGADLQGADLQGAYLQGAYLWGARVRGRKVDVLRAFTGLYPYSVWAVLFEDGSRWVRMGCLFKSLDDWEQIGIRQSNLNEFPDDGSEQCEERVAAFEFAKAAALRLKAKGGRDAS